MLKNKEQIRKLAEEVAAIIAKVRPAIEPMVENVAKAGTTLTAIILKKKGSGKDFVAPTFYIEHFLNEAGTDNADEIAGGILAAYDNASEYIKSDGPGERAAEALENILTTEKLKEHLEVRLISKSLSRELVEKGPARKFVNDLYIVPYMILVEMDDGARYCARVTSDMLNKSIFDTEDELIDAALICAENKDKMSKMMMPPCFSIITNEIGTFGASAICYKGALDQIFEDIGKENYYIVPSSVHEVLIVPESTEDVKWLQMMVLNTNKNPLVVSPEEVLSYDVYHYNGETKALTCPTANMGVADQMQYMYSRATGVLN